MFGLCEIKEYHAQQSLSESSESEEMSENGNHQSINDEYRKLNARGRGHGRGAARGNGAARRSVRRNRQQEDGYLQIQCTSNDRGQGILLFNARQGLQVQLPDSASAGENLSLCLSDEFFDLLVEQTDLYAAQYKYKILICPKTNEQQIKKSLARSFLVGVVRKPEFSYPWSTNPWLKGSIFNSVMPGKRFQLILQFLHFADNSPCNANDPNRDRLNKVSAVIQYFVSKLKNVYIQEEHISIDEEFAFVEREAIVQAVHRAKESTIRNQDV